VTGAVGLEARDLAVSFGGRAVVGGVSLAVLPGEVVGLLGPNGAGKTTTFRMIAGLVEPDAGEVSLDGRRLAGPLHSRVRAGLGYLPQRSTVFRGLTVRQHLLVPLEARLGDRAARAAEADRLLAEAGLSALSAADASRLSGGERRRLEIARCLAGAPRVLLLDEPFAGVDPVAVGELTARIRGLADHGVGVLITDHAVREAMGVCDRVVLLDAGQVLIAGTPAEISADPRARERWLGQGYQG
jgi:lipopolysaccharide export system ATP-binding protein